MSAVIGTMAAATALNGVAVVKKGKDPLTTFVAAGAFTMLLEFLADYVDEGLAETFAGVFLLGSFMVNYQAFTQLVGYFTTPETGVK